MDKLHTRARRRHFPRRFVTLQARAEAVAGPLLAIFNNGAVIDFVTVQRHVQVGAVALRKGG